MIRCGKSVVGAVLLLAGPAGVGGSGPALKSSTASVQIRAVVQERLSLVSGTPLGFSRDAWQALRGEAPISFTTRWNLDATRTAVVVSAFFEEASGAVTGAGARRASKRVSPPDVRDPAVQGVSSSYVTLASWPGRGMEVFRQQLKPRVNDMGSRTDELEVHIDLRNKQRPSSGADGGVLTLVAEAY